MYTSNNAGTTLLNYELNFLTFRVEKKKIGIFIILFFFVKLNIVFNNTVRHLIKYNYCKYSYTILYFLL